MATSSAGIRVEGANELRRTMRRAGEDLGDLKEAHAEAAGIAGRRAQGDTPRKSGRLAAKVRWAASNTSATIRAGNNTTVRYAGAIHWGWRRRNIKPQPWITEAAQATEPEWSAAYTNAVETILGRIKGV